MFLKDLQRWSTTPELPELGLVVSACLILHQIAKDINAPFHYVELPRLLASLRLHENY